jgi:hypothetical protein
MDCSISSFASVPFPRRWFLYSTVIKTQLVKPHEGIVHHPSRMSERIATTVLYIQELSPP